MILLKIGDDGELIWNQEEIAASAKLFDEGWCSEETEKAKLLQLIWEAGFNAAMDDVQTFNERAMLLFSGVGGHA